jgi:hypothetical protein
MDPVDMGVELVARVVVFAWARMVALGAGAGGIVHGVAKAGQDGAR